MIKNTVLKFFACPILLLTFAVAPAFSQNAAPDGLLFDLFPAQGQMIGTDVNIDTGYALKFDITVLEPFSVKVVQKDKIEFFLHTADRPDVDLFKITFFGREAENPDNIYLIENITFFPFTLELAPPQDRIENLATLLVQTVFPSMVASFPQNEFLGWRATKIGKNDAVEAIGRYMDPQTGLMALRIVGVIKPDSSDGIYAVSNVVSRLYPFSGPGDIGLTLTGVAMRNFTYLNQ
ncbi:MAG: hypothetical protein L3J21_04215 [Devosiaceae bacterium]|nr:hypothetical protein [Devosiaceae bacterium]